MIDRVAVAASRLRALQLGELEQRRVTLAPRDAMWLQRTHGRHISVIRTPETEDGWVVRPGPICGVIPLPSGRRLYVEPRVPVRNVWTMIAKTGNAGCLNWPPGETETFGGLVDGMMEVFVQEVERLIARGVAVGYQATERVLPAVRGRIDLPRQLRELPGVPDRFACRYAEFSRDTPENRVLAAALQVVLRIAESQSNQRARATRCLREIGGGAQVIMQRGQLAAAGVNAATRHYRIPLALARLLLEGLGASHRPVRSFHPAQTPSLLVEMPRLFERFICRTLERGLARVRWTGHSVPLDAGSHAMLNPDAVVEGGRGPLCVVDAKYKPETADRHEPSAADLYQMLAYCVGYDVRHAVLVYPRPIDAAPVRIRRGDFSATIHALGIDLSAEAHSLGTHGERLCAQIADLTGLPDGVRL